MRLKSEKLWLWPCPASTQLCDFRQVTFPLWTTIMPWINKEWCSRSSCPVKPSLRNAGTAQDVLWKKELWDQINLRKATLKLNWFHYKQSLEPWTYDLLTITLQHRVQQHPDFFFFWLWRNFIFFLRTIFHIPQDMVLGNPGSEDD